MTAITAPTSSMSAVAVTPSSNPDGVSSVLLPGETRASVVLLLLPFLLTALVAIVLLHPGSAPNARADLRSSAPAACVSTVSPSPANC